MNAEIERLPHVDEHAVEIAAPPAAVWAALPPVFEGSFSPGAVSAFARLLGCADTAAAGPRPLAVGSAVPGFHVVAALAPGEAAGEPAELATAGSHRFSRYALIFRLDDLGGGRTRLRGETRAEFPGFRGGVYETLVIRTRMHVLVTRRLLRAVKARAERG